MDFARTTAGQYNVSLRRLRAAEIPVPPLADQREIIAELDTLQTEVDALLSLQSKKTVELNALLPPFSTDRSTADSKLPPRTDRWPLCVEVARWR